MNNNNARSSECIITHRYTHTYLVFIFSTMKIDTTTIAVGTAHVQNGYVRTYTAVFVDGTKKINVGKR